jgi:hypothetical protein
MNDFVAGHLPFWFFNYTLALLAWACIGRFMMSVFIAPASPNYIWRGFRLLTDWAVAAARRLVPSYVRPQFLPLIACCWLFAIRWTVGLSMIGAGLAPQHHPGGRLSHDQRDQLHPHRRHLPDPRPTQPGAALRRLLPPGLAARAAAGDARDRLLRR